MGERLKYRILILCGALLLMLIQATLLPENPVWITDNGNKYMILRNFAESRSIALVNPAADIDPEGRYFPDGGFHFHRYEGKIFSVYPEFFPLLVLPGFQLFGPAGLWLLPIGGMLALLALFLTLLSRCHLSWKLETLCTGVLLCGTPFLFYSGTFWEMTLAATLALAALVAVSKRRFFETGVLLGLGCVLREEFFLLAVISGVAGLCFQRKDLRPYVKMAAGFLIFAIPLLLYNFVNYGHILGLHGSLYYTHNREVLPTIAERFTGIFEGYFIYLFKFNSGGNPWMTSADWLLCLPFLLLPVAGFFRSRSFKFTAALMAIAAFAVHFWRLWNNPDIPMTSGLLIGLFPSLPILAGFFLCWRSLLTRGPLAQRMAALGCILYILILPPVLTRTDIGIIWGARHFLFIAPVLLLLSLAGFARIGFLAKGKRWIPAAFLAASVLLQAFGIKALFTVAEDAAEIRIALQESSDEVVVSNAFYLPEMTPELFFEKKWLYVKDDEALHELPGLLRKAGVEEFTFLMSPRFSGVSQEAFNQFSRQVENIPGLTDGDGISFKPEVLGGESFLFLYRIRFRLK